MATDRQRRLATLAWANAQKRSREELLASLGQRNRQRLEQAPCVYSSDADLTLRRVLPIDADRVGTTDTARLEGFRFLVTGKPDRALERVRLLPQSHDFSPAILVLPGVEVIRFGVETECVPTYPLFRLRFGDARRLFEDIWRPKSDFSGVFTENFTAGVLIDTYGEYPEFDAGPDECTYEVASWAAA